jgi:hypothetical protein
MVARVVWAIGAALVLMGLLISTVILGLATDEQICLDRWPWWGPPENPDSTCTGHIYERRHGSSR